MVDYVKGLASGHIDFFPRLPKGILLNIIQLLDLEDFSRLTQVSKQFKDVGFMWPFSIDLVEITFIVISTITVPGKSVCVY